MKSSMLGTRLETLKNRGRVNCKLEEEQKSRLTNKNK